MKNERNVNVNVIRREYDKNLQYHRKIYYTFESELKLKSAFNGETSVLLLCSISKMMILNIRAPFATASDRPPKLTNNFR